MKKLYCLVILFLLVITVNGCGYRIGSLLPADLKTIAVPIFKNKTPEPGLDVPVTEGIIQELIFDGTLEVVEEDDADTLLIGEIISYKREPLRYDNEVTSEYRLLIGVRLKFLDLRHKKVIWTYPAVYGDATFFVGLSLPESEQTALPDVIEDLAHEVVEKVVEGGW